MRRRIVICLGLLLALCLIGDVIALLALNQSIARFEELGQLYRIQSIRESLSFDGVRTERDLMARLIELPDSDEQFRESILRFKHALRQCSSCHHEPDVMARLENVKQTFGAFLDASQETLESATGPKAEESRGEAVALANQVVIETTAMVEDAHLSLRAKTDDVMSIVHVAWVTLCATLVAALIFGGMIALHLLQRLTQPVTDLLELVEHSKPGGQSNAPSVAGDDEFQQLGAAFNQAYGRLESAQKEVQGAQKLAALGQLGAGVAHEVLNPLTGISCLVQLMRSEGGPESHTERLDLIKENIDRISKIVREFQNFSRPFGAERLTAVSVPGLLDRAVQLLGYDKRSQGIEMVRDYPDDLDPILADADRLVVVFTNIMLNAIDALGERDGPDPVLEISARREDDKLVVRFADNGPGMSTDQISSAFEPFFTTKPAGSGTGLGLWVCFETIRGHNGTIALASREEGGMLVTVELPYGD